MVLGQAIFQGFVYVSLVECKIMDMIEYFVNRKEIRDRIIELCQSYVASRRLSGRLFIYYLFQGSQQHGYLYLAPQNR